MVPTDPARKQRLRDLQAQFNLEEEYGTTPTWSILAETLADHLNRKHGRQVVIPRDRKR